MARFNSSVQRAFVDATASGDTAVVAAAGAGNYIKVIRFRVISKTALDVRFRSGTTSISELMGFAAGGGFRDGMVRSEGDPEDCLFQTAANAALNINLSGSGNVGVSVGYFISRTA